MTPKEKAVMEKICPAIKEKKLIKFWYDDKTEDKRGWRIVEPHQIVKLKPKAVGSAESNVMFAWFLPTDEQMMNEWSEGWKQYLLERIDRIEILDQKYSFTRIGYDPLARKSRYMNYF
jgi:hypothetical protein